MRQLEDERELQKKIYMTQASPWRRFWARTIDMFIIELIVKVLQTIFFRGAYFDPTLLSAGSFLIWAFAEAHLLHTWGSTPGKWMFKIKVRKNDLGKPEFTESIKRSILVWIFGMGMGIVSTMTYIISYHALTRRGFTLWDKYSGCGVFYEKMSENRILATVFVIVALTISIAILVLVNYYSSFPAQAPTL